MNKTLAAGLGLLVVAGLAFYWMQTAPPGDGADHAMTPPETGQIAEGAPLVEVALPAELSVEAEVGQRIFEAKCAACHGVNAAGQNGVAPPLVHQIYEPGHHSDMAFVLAARNGVRSHHWRFGNMPPVDGLTDADIAMVTRYVRELQAENGIF